MIEADESKKFSCFLDKVRIIVVNAVCKSLDLFLHSLPSLTRVAGGCALKLPTLALYNVGGFSV